jgi:hypothetical protein
MEEVAQGGGTKARLIGTPVTVITRAAQKRHMVEVNTLGGE